MYTVYYNWLLLPSNKGTNCFFFNPPFLNNCVSEVEKFRKFNFVSSYRGQDEFFLPNKNEVKISSFEALMRSQKFSAVLHNS